MKRTFRYLSLTCGIGFSAAASIPGNAIAFPHNGVVQVSAGATYTCALFADHNIQCWGSGAVASSLSPAQAPPQIRNAIAIATGADFACALLSDHTVECWGSNNLGQWGNGKLTNYPIPVSRDSHHTIGEITAISAGGQHACALQQSITGASQIYCWGANNEGEIGNFAAGAEADFATAVVIEDGGFNPTLTNVVSVTAGDFHTCAMRTDHTGACWGLNSLGQLGSANTVSTDSPTSVEAQNVAGVSPLAMIDRTLSAGDYHSCGLVLRPAPLNNGVACWGSNLYGQLGNPTNAFSGAVTTAVPVLFSPAVELNNVTAVSSGGDFTCALLSNGQSVECWGSNDKGRLGNGGTTSSDIPVLVALHGISSVSSLSAGTKHACALLDNEVGCWGSNDSGQLGFGYTDFDIHAKPTIVPLDSPIFTDNFEGE